MPAAVGATAGPSPVAPAEAAVAPPAAVVGLTVLPPTVLAGAGAAVALPAVVVGLTVSPPAALMGVGPAVAPPAAVVGLTVSPPAVLVGAGAAVAPPAQVVGLTVSPPTALEGAGVAVAPPMAVVGLTVLPPTALAGAGIEAFTGPSLVTTVGQVGSIHGGFLGFQHTKRLTSTSGVPLQLAVSPNIAHPTTGGPVFVAAMPALRPMPSWATGLGLVDGRQALIWDSG